MHITLYSHVFTMHMHACIYTEKHIHKHTYLCIFKSDNMHIQILVYNYIRMHIYHWICIFLKYICRHMKMNMWIFMSLKMHKWIGICVNIYVYLCAYWLYMLNMHIFLYTCYIFIYMLNMHIFLYANKLCVRIYIVNVHMNICLHAYLNIYWYFEYAYKHSLLNIHKLVCLCMFCCVYIHRCIYVHTYP